MVKIHNNNFNRKEQITQKLHSLAKDDYTVLLNLYQEINYIDNTVFKFSCVDYLFNALHFADNINIEELVEKLTYGNVNDPRELVRCDYYGNYENVSDEQLQQECEDDTNIWALIGWLDNHSACKNVWKILTEYGLEEYFVYE
ncbi:hypothetical protein SAMN04489758_1284 [Thomasclavelia cocleata]|uniref:Uncharacterized protein n=1 Tax=Thomasclavelia cocleata TaxID=69824 RepID=A0A1I0GB70_9FIRM|nr:hypothetical protein [Thomasclavelia cocleata]MCR1959829.1 hypothetical protein [Thomasclavelia cocleata]NDO43179.1 hypothetical protein [Thomasclavelia cocleata]SET68244.1 hypothetical protein SAMN04489758_1284 [Thomasclavelia cocleata]